MTRAVIYARYSSHAQNDASIEQQVAECRAFAEREGYAVVEIYADHAMSGTSDKRPEFQRMIKDSEKKSFQIVVVWKLDRFARSRYDSAFYKARLKKSGVRVVSAKESITDSPEGIILEGMLESMAEYYSANLSQNVLRGMRDNAARGRFNGGNIPLGYKAVDGRLVEDASVSPHVRWAFEAYASGANRTDIARELNARGVRSRRGRPLTGNSLQHTFANRVYIGEYSFDGQPVQGIADRIVSDEVFRAAAARLEKNRRAPASHKAPVSYLLTGRAFCGLCGAPMTGESGQSRRGVIYRYYKCASAKHSRTCRKRAEVKDTAESFVVRQTLDCVFRPERVRAAARAVAGLYNREYAASGLAEAEKRLADIDAEIYRRTEALLDLPKSARQPIIDRLNALDAERDDLDARLAELRAAAGTRLDEDEAYRWIMSFKDGDPEDPDFCQRLIDTFVNSVFFFDDKIAIFYNLRDGEKPLSLEEVRDAIKNKSESPEVDDSDLTDTGGPTPTKSEPLYVIRSSFGYLFTHISDTRF